MKHWENYSSWEEAEKKWDEGAATAQQQKPLKRLKVLPHMPGIAPGEEKNLKWKSFKYLLLQREGKKILSHLLKRPIRYSWGYVKSLFKKKPYLRDKDFYLYGVKSLEAFEKILQEKELKLVIGFSYCQKPFECPSGRFTDQCCHDVESPICRQCDIGKVMHALPERAIPLMIPTVHYIGEKMFEIVAEHKKVAFLITACEMTLEMFGDFGNMLSVPGIGVRLDGRICNTLQAFHLSEKGIKPGLTLVTQETQERLLHLVRSLRM